MKKGISILLAVMLAALVVLAAGCGSQQQGNQQAPAQAKVIKVGSDTAYAPFEFQDEQTKEYIGFDMDLIKAIGKQMGTEMQIVSMNFDGLIPALEAGNVDMAVSAMTITDERKQQVNFSQAYYKSGLAIVVKSDNNTIKGFNDLKGKNIAVQIGTTGADEAKKIEGAKVREFNTMPEAFLELKNGGVDACVNDLPVNLYYIQKSGGKDAKIVGDKLTAEDYGFAFNKKNTELVDKVNKALDELKKNGEYDKIYQKWFGTAPAK